VLAWAFEITTTGLKRTEDVSLEESITHVTGRKLDFIVIGFLVAALSLSLYANLRSPPDSLVLPDPVSILIADFTNDSGNELFTGVLEDTLRIGIEATRFVETYPRKDTRKLASEIAASGDANTILSPELASQVAIGQGVDIVVSGNVSRSNGEILVAIAGVNSADQTILFELSESAENDEEMLTAIASLAIELRSELGDTNGDFSSDNSGSFWVANLSAASEFLHAQELGSNVNLEEAVRHYSRAIELDPGLIQAYAGRGDFVPKGT